MELSKAEFDVWKDHDGHIMVSRAAKAFVTDVDAPYGFYTHEIRVVAASAREALAACRAELKSE